MRIPREQILDMVSALEWNKVWSNMESYILDEKKYRNGKEREKIESNDEKKIFILNEVIGDYYYRVFDEKEVKSFDVSLKEAIAWTIIDHNNDIRSILTSIKKHDVVTTTADACLLVLDDGENDSVHVDLKNYPGDVIDLKKARRYGVMKQFLKNYGINSIKVGWEVCSQETLARLAMLSWSDETVDQGWSEILQDEVRQRKYFKRISYAEICAQVEEQLQRFDTKFNFAQLLEMWVGAVIDTDDVLIRNVFPPSERENVKIVWWESFTKASRNAYTELPWLTREIVQNFTDHNKDNPNTLDGVEIETQVTEEGNIFQITWNRDFENATALFSGKSQKEAENSWWGNGLWLKQVAMIFMRDYKVKEFNVYGKDWVLSYEFLSQEKINARLKDSDIEKEIWEGCLVAHLKKTPPRNFTRYEIITENNSLTQDDFVANKVDSIEGDPLHDSLKQCKNLWVHAENPMTANLDIVTPDWWIQILPPNQQGWFFLNGQRYAYRPDERLKKYTSLSKSLAKEENIVPADSPHMVTHCDEYRWGPTWLNLVALWSYEITIDRPPMNGRKAKDYLAKISNKVPLGQAVEILKKHPYLRDVVGDNWYEYDQYSDDMPLTERLAKILVDKVVYVIERGDEEDTEKLLWVWFKNWILAQNYIACDIDEKSKIRKLKEKWFRLCPQYFKGIWIPLASSKIEREEKDWYEGWHINRSALKEAREKMALDWGIYVGHRSLYDIDSKREFYNYLFHQFTIGSHSFEEGRKELIMEVGITKQEILRRKWNWVGGRLRSAYVLWVKRWYISDLFFYIEGYKVLFSYDAIEDELYLKLEEGWKWDGDKIYCEFETKTEVDLLEDRKLKELPPKEKKGGNSVSAKNNTSKLEQAEKKLWTFVKYAKIIGKLINSVQIEQYTWDGYKIDMQHLHESRDKFSEFYKKYETRLGETLSEEVARIATFIDGLSVYEESEVDAYFENLLSTCQEAEDKLSSWDVTFDYEGRFEKIEEELEGEKLEQQKLHLDEVNSHVFQIQQLEWRTTVILSRLFIKRVEEAQEKVNVYKAAVDNSPLVEDFLENVNYLIKYRKYFEKWVVRKYGEFAGKIERISTLRVLTSYQKSSSIVRKVHLDFDFGNFLGVEEGLEELKACLEEGDLEIRVQELGKLKDMDQQIKATIEEKKKKIESDQEGGFFKKYLNIGTDKEKPQEAALLEDDRLAKTEKIEVQNSFNSALDYIMVTMDSWVESDSGWWSGEHEHVHGCKHNMCADVEDFHELEDISEVLQLKLKLLKEYAWLIIGEEPYNEFFVYTWKWAVWVNEGKKRIGLNYEIMKKWFEHVLNTVFHEIAHNSYRWHDVWFRRLLWCIWNLHAKIMHTIAEKQANYDSLTWEELRILQIREQWIGIQEEV